MTPPAGRLRVVGDGMPHRTRVLVDDVDVSGQVRSVSWEHVAGELPVVRVSFILTDVDLSVAVEEWSSVKAPEPVEVFTTVEFHGDREDVTSLVDVWRQWGRTRGAA